VNPGFPTPQIFSPQKSQGVGIAKEVLLNSCGLESASASTQFK